MKENAFGNKYSCERTKNKDNNKNDNEWMVH